jgi:hypothetical protein
MRWIGKLPGWAWTNLGNLALIAGWIVTIAVPAWAVSVVTQLQAYAPASWIFAGLLGGVLSAAGFALFGWGKARSAQAVAIAKWKDQVSTINPLDDEFHKKRIKLEDLVDPTGTGVVKKKFTSCELLGPINLVGLGGRMMNSTFMRCNVILLTTDQNVYLHRFIDCTIDNCTIYDCNIFIPEAVYGAFKANNPGMPVIGDPKSWEGFNSAQGRSGQEWRASPPPA